MLKVGIPVIKFHGDFSKTNLISIFEKCTHKLDDFVLNMKGMSGRKYRAFINNFIEANPGSRYLEVGSWAGSTACSAIYRNKLKATCIDNWSEFGGPKDEFLKNIRYVSKKSKVDFTFIEKDFRKVDFEELGKFNIYLFDGPHEEIDHYHGIISAQPALDDTYLLVVDDWNWKKVKNGTSKALSEVANIVCSITIRTMNEPKMYKQSDWHNGYFICVCKKKSSITKLLK